MKKTNTQISDYNMEISFTKISIQNFRGIVALDLQLQGSVVRISGANGSGKTTVADAILWTLFGKDSLQRTTFPIDPMDDGGRVIHHLETAVTLSILIDGQGTTLRRKREERWVQRAGNAAEVLDGHRTTCYIDGHPVPLKEYADRVAGICEEKLFRAVTDPLYFPTLPQDMQYAVLCDIVGTRSLTEIAAPNPRALAVADHLEGRTIDQFLQGVRYDLQRAKNERELIPPRIAEVQGFIHQTDDAHAKYGEAKRRITEITSELDGINGQMDSVAAAFRAENAQYEAARKDYERLLKERDGIERDILTTNREAERVARERLLSAKNAVQELMLEKASCSCRIEEAIRVCEQIDEEVGDFRKRWQEVEAMRFTWNDDTEAICPTCGQHLPPMQGEEARRKAEERFNARKAAKQDALDKEAERIAASKETAKKRREAAERRLAELDGQLIPAAEKELGEAEAATVTYLEAKDNARWQELNEQITKATSGQHAASEPPTLKELREKRRTLEAELAEARRIVGIEEQRAAYEKRLDELNKQRAQLSQFVAERQADAEAADELRRMEAADLEQRVNALFRTVRFRFSREQINGKEVRHTELTVNGVPYSGLSHAERINAGLELVDALSLSRGVTAPVIIDNAEAINTITPTRGQQIRLAVSTSKKLRVDNAGAPTEQSLFN